MLSPLTLSRRTCSPAMFPLEESRSLLGCILSHFLACFCLLGSRAHEVLETRPMFHPSLMVPSGGAVLLLGGVVENGTDPGRQSHWCWKCPSSTMQFYVCFTYQNRMKIRLMNTTLASLTVCAFVWGLQRGIQSYWLCSVLVSFFFGRWATSKIVYNVWGHR